MKQIQGKGPISVRNYSITPVLSQAPRQPIIDLQTLNQTASKSHPYSGKLLPDGTNPYTTHIPVSTCTKNLFAELI